MEIERTPILRRGEEFSFEIPVNLLREFEKEIRIVIRHPWVVGIPVPEVLLKPGTLGKLKEFNVMLIPKELTK